MCINCEMTITVSLVNIHYHTQRGLVLSLPQIQCWTLGLTLELPFTLLKRACPFSESWPWGGEQFLEE